MRSVSCSILLNVTSVIRHVWLLWLWRGRRKLKQLWRRVTFLSRPIWGVSVLGGGEWQGEAGWAGWEHRSLHCNTSPPHNTNSSCSQTLNMLANEYIWIYSYKKINTNMIQINVCKENYTIIFPQPFSHLIESSSLFQFQTHAWIINKSLHTYHGRAYHNPHKHIFHWIPNVTFCIWLYCRFDGNVAGADGLSLPLSHNTHPPMQWYCICMNCRCYLSENVLVQIALCICKMYFWKL